MLWIFIAGSANAARLADMQKTAIAATVIFIYNPLIFAPGKFYLTGDNISKNFIFMILIDNIFTFYI